MMFLILSQTYDIGTYSIASSLFGFSPVCIAFVTFSHSSFSFSFIVLSCVKSLEPKLLEFQRSTSYSDQMKIFFFFGNEQNPKKSKHKMMLKPMCILMKILNSITNNTRQTEPKAFLIQSLLNLFNVCFFRFSFLDSVVFTTQDCLSHASRWSL